MAKSKSTGTVYTPLPIARYMCDLALAHLPTDKPLRILDPAAGDGVFPRELMSITPDAHYVLCDINKEALHSANQSLALAQSLAVNDSFFNLPTHLPNTQFDLIIGNPPYLKEYTNREAFHGIPYYQGKMDLWYAFACRSFDLLKPGGILCFIATNNWTTNQGASILREKMAREMRILQLIDFGDCQVFGDAAVQTMILLLRKDDTQERYPFEYHRYPGEGGGLPEALNFLNTLDPASAQRTFDRERMAKSLYRFPAPDIEALLNQIEAKQNFSLRPEEIIQGIVPNPDVLGPRNMRKIPSAEQEKRGLTTGQGVFVLRPEEIPQLNPQEASYLKPVYEAAKVDRFFLPPAPSKWMLYLTSRNLPNGLVELTGIQAHLEQFREIMEDRRENKKGRIAYFHLHWPRNEKFFEAGPRILSVRKCKEPTFVYTEQPAYVMLSFNVIQTQRIDLLYLTGLLNSKLIEFWLQHRGKLQGGQFQVDRAPLLQIPIHIGTKKEVTQVANLTQKIITHRQATQSPTTPQPHTQPLETQLNQAINKIYNLPPQALI